MHVLYIHQHFAVPEHGGGTRSYEFAKRLVKNGHKVTLVCGNSENIGKTLGCNSSFLKRLTIEGIDVVFINVRYTNSMSSLRRILSFLLFTFYATLVGLFLKKPDLVFASSTPLTVGIPGVIIAKARRAKFVFEVRDLWPEAPIQMGVFRNRLIIAILRFLESWIYAHAEKIIALSPGMAAGVIAAGVSQEKVVVIPNSSDLELFGNAAYDQGLIRKLGLEGKFLVLYAGALGEANDLSFIIDGAEMLREVPDICFVLAGDGKQKELLVEEAKRRGLKNVLFTGRLSKMEVAKLYKAAQVSLVFFKDLPILQTNSPNKFFDSLAAGCPVITNMDGWIRQLVEDNECGVYIVPGKVSQFAEALMDFYKNPDKVERFGRNARRLAETSFDRDVLARKLIMAFEDVIKNANTKDFGSGCVCS